MTGEMKMNKTEQDILTWCKKEGRSGWLSVFYFRGKTNKSTSTISKALKTLCGEGILERKKGWYSSDITGRSIKKYRYYYRLKEV